MQSPIYYLVGDFNDWIPGSEEYRFAEVTSPYGMDENGVDHPYEALALGSFYLECEMPHGTIQFKIIEGTGWERQWAVGWGREPGDFTADCFRTRHGLRPRLIRFCGGGMPPHAEFKSPGGRLRWDFHPESCTLTIHSEFRRLPGPIVEKWEDFSCEDGAVFSTWVSLPYGYDPMGGFTYPLCIFFDGRDLIYGEDSWLGSGFNIPRRQFVRVFDTLSRHGIIAPTIVVGVGVPRYPHRRTPSRLLGLRDRVNAYSFHFSDLHNFYLESISRDVVPALENNFPISHKVQDRILLGHSNGGDVGLALLRRSPNLFGGGIFLSPGGLPDLINELEDISLKQRRQLRLGIAYSTEEPDIGFSTHTARAGLLLTRLEIPHVVTLNPRASHDPASMYDTLFALLAFVMG